MKNRYPLDGTLLQALCSAALLAPALRLIPGQAAHCAGRVCWASVLAAAPFILLDIWFLSAFLKNREPGEGLREMLARALGPVFGALVTGIFAAWMLFYCGFIRAPARIASFPRCTPTAVPCSFPPPWRFAVCRRRWGGQRPCAGCPRSCCR